MKVREIIKIKGWIDGSGWSHSQTISNTIFDIEPERIAPNAPMDWDWWELNDDPTPGQDTEVTVAYYAPDDEEQETPLITWTTWESEIRNMRG